MNREQMLEAMLAAYHPDWNDADWPEAWRNEERTDMGRALDAIQASQAELQPDPIPTEPKGYVRYCANCGTPRTIAKEPAPVPVIACNAPAWNGDRCRLPPGGHDYHQGERSGWPAQSVKP